jgi:hypothetical protein
MTTLLILLAASVVVGGFIGLVARMPLTEIVGQCLAMCGAAVLFWSLVELL